MKVVLVDDEALSLQMLEYFLKKIPDIEVEASFTEPIEALEFLLHHETDVVFLDIEMPGISGIDIARRIGQSSMVIFVTAFPQYSIDAWDVEAVDYILKPYEEEKIRRALTKAKRLQSGANIVPVYVKCFPVFDILINDVPYSFRNKKAKEMLAYLVHCKGRWCSIDEVIFNVLEDMDEASAKNYVRQIVYRLRGELKKIGLDHILVSEYGKYRVCLDSIPCDYFEYLNGTPELFQGEYLNEYSWAEPYQAQMLRKQRR